MLTRTKYHVGAVFFNANKFSFVASTMFAHCEHSVHYYKMEGFSKLISKKERVLQELRIVRKAKKMSYQCIVDATESIGAAVSMSSVRRVFDERFNADDFKYETTLKPIVRVVMGIEEDFYEEPQTLPEATASVEGLVAVVDYKDAKIEQLEAELARYRKEDEEERNDDAKALQKARKWLLGFIVSSVILSILLIVCLMFLEAYIVLDIDHPELGLFFN